MLDAIRAFFRKPGKVSKRMYASAKAGRLTSGWQTANNSADAELSSSLTALRTRSRALIRDAAYAKRARVIVVNNIVGSGIGLQAQVLGARGELRANVNSSIEAAWCEWCRSDSAHTGGAMHFADIERMAMGEVFTAGEVFIRKHYRPFGRSKIPLSLEVIEAERIADDFEVMQPVTPGNIIRMGIEVDQFYRPVAYWIRQRHPNELRTKIEAKTVMIERVPADQIMHLRIVDRWPQSRGEPWLHAVARRLNDMDGYSEAEIVAARASASYMGFIKSPEDQTGDQVGDQMQLDMEPGIIQHLAPGEEFIGWSPNRPNAGADPFMRLMLREVAAGVGVSYESLSRDYSQSNYSSSRLALIDDRDLWRTLQQWFIRSFRVPLHREWLQQAVLAGAVPGIALDQYLTAPDKFAAVAFKPRGWSWIDPTKEVNAYKEAVRCGFTTVGDVIAATGGGVDLEDVLTARARELEMMEAAGLMFDTDPAIPATGANPAPASAETPDQVDPAADPGDQEDPADTTDTTDTAQPARVYSLPRKQP